MQLLAVCEQRATGRLLLTYKNRQQGVENVDVALDKPANEGKHRGAKTGRCGTGAEPDLLSPPNLTLVFQGDFSESIKSPFCLSLGQQMLTHTSPTHITATPYFSPSFKCWPLRGEWWAGGHAQFFGFAFCFFRSICQEPESSSPITFGNKLLVPLLLLPYAQNSSFFLSRRRPAQAAPEECLAVILSPSRDLFPTNWARGLNEGAESNLFSVSQ